MKKIRIKTVILGALIGLGLYSWNAMASGPNFNDTSSQPLIASSNPNFSVNVGIGSAHPGQKLDVQGTVRTTGFTMSGQSPLSGYVLTSSDTLGDATWSSAGGVSGWTITNTNDVYATFGGNVGIGTTFTNAGGALSVMNGNVGIGTWAPTTSLQTSGDVTFLSGSTRNIYIESNATLNSQTDLSIYAGVMLCLAANTKITMGDGSLKNIQDVKIGDIVQSYDVKTKQVKNERVTKIIAHSSKEDGNGYVILTMQNGHILKATPNHRIYANGQWVEAGKLKVDDQLLQVDGSHVKIVSIQYLKQEIPVYNIEVEQYHTYFAEGVLVHNFGCFGPGGTLYLSGGMQTGGLGTATTGNTIINYNSVGFRTNTGLVGISTVSPVSQVSILGNVAIAKSGGDSYLTTAAPSGGMIIEGNVGIGSVNPGKALDVQGSVRSTGFTMSGQSPLSGYVLTSSDTLGDTTWSSAGGVSGWTITNTNDVYETYNSNVGIGTTFTSSGAALTVMNGNVGIGTWVPAKPFSVIGDAYHSGNVGIGTTFTSSGAALSVMNGNVGIGTWKPGSPLQVLGNVGIGTSTTASTPSYTLNVNNDIVYNSVWPAGSSSTALTITWSNGNLQKVTMTGNCVFTFTAPSAPSRLSLELVQDGSGSHTAAWPTAVKWSGGSAPTLTTTPTTGTDLLSCLYDGTNYLCSANLDLR